MIKSGELKTHKASPGDNARKYLVQVQTMGEGCWTWPGAMQNFGYGTVHMGGGVGNKQAHVWVYTQLVGQIPEGLFLDHLCHTRDLSCFGGSTCKHRSCVNPAHLEPVTFQENMARGRKAQHRKTHCPYGHDYKTVTVKTGKSAGKIQRMCPTCARDRGRQRLAGTYVRKRPHGGVNVNALKTHCKRGHEFTAENTRIVRGSRKCLTCPRERYHEKRLREAAAA